MKLAIAVVVVVLAAAAVAERHPFGFEYSLDKHGGVTAVVDKRTAENDSREVVEAIATAVSELHWIEWNWIIFVEAPRTDAKNEAIRRATTAFRQIAAGSMHRDCPCVDWAHPSVRCNNRGDIPEAFGFFSERLQRELPLNPGLGLFTSCQCK